MNIFYEETGHFKCANVIQRNDASYQADTSTGKRVKVKASNVFFEFNGDCVYFLEKATQIASEIDIELMWEATNSEEFSYEQVANEYFGNTCSKEELAATLMALYNAPIYFHKKSKGKFKAADEKTIKLALAAIERKKIEEQQIDNWVKELSSNSLPESIANDLTSILHKPDKQSLTYKAFSKAAETLKISPLDLAFRSGGLTSIHQYLFDNFLINCFADEITLPEIEIEPFGTLPEADGVYAFSIDDSKTTEIDDAISVIDIDGGKKRLGIHIAAPSLSILAGSLIEKQVFKRLSTVYFPTGKIQMLPDNWIEKFSLNEKEKHPCVSIYFDIDADGNFSEPSHKIEMVYIADNLRIQDILPYFNRETGCNIGDEEKFPHHAILQQLYVWAIALQKQRGKYVEDAPIRYEYTVEVDENEYVSVVKRERDSPLDMVVGEMMILANSTWAKILDTHEASGIFRVQSPSGTVRMSSLSDVHDGLGLSHYAWCTSPLRRAADYVNQRQLIALIDSEHYSLRFQKNDNELYLVLRNFDATYNAYIGFQRKMERYWSLIWIKQEKITELLATVIKGDLVSIEGLPINVRVLGMPIDILPKVKVRLKVGNIDLMTQMIELHYINVAL